MIEKALVNRLKFSVIVATHMRPGTHLVIDLIRRQFPGLGGCKFPLEANDTVYFPVDSLYLYRRRVIAAETEGIGTRDSTLYSR